MNDRNPSHDDFIRNILSNKEIAVAYFKSYLPAFVSKRLDFSELQQLPDTYLSDELKKSMSDIVYSCKLKNSKESVQVSLLIEHKSYPDKYTSVQIGAYIFSAFQKQIKNKEPLFLVIPVLLYHGKTKWKYSPLKSLFEDIDNDWKQFLPNFEYVYNDLGLLSDKEIEALNNKFLAASILALKHSQEKEWIEQNAIQLLMLASHGSKGLRKGFIIYLYSRSRLEEKTLNSLPEAIKKDVMNTLDIYFERGVEKGKEQIVQNLINTGKFTMPEIANLAGVPEAFVKKVNILMKKKN